MLPSKRAFTLKVQPLGDRRVKFIASTNGVDRHGTRLRPKGCRYTNYLKNPVFLWNHRKHEEAEPEDVIGHVVDIRITNKTVEVTVEFKTHREDGSIRQKAWDCYQDVLAGILRAVSVGFIPLVENPKFRSPQEAEAYLAKGGVVDVEEWELCELSLTIVPSNPDAVAQRSFCLRMPSTSSIVNRETFPILLKGAAGMDPKMVLEKLGVAADADPDAIVAALMKYLAGADSDTDKQSVVKGLLQMLVPAAPSAPAEAAPSSSSASDMGDAREEALMDEVKSLRARAESLENEIQELKARAEAPAKPDEKPEEMADRAIKAGQWPDSGRKSLVERYLAKKPVKLFDNGTFVNRSARVTSGGNPTGNAQPNFGQDSKVKEDVKGLFKVAERGVATLTGADRKSNQ
jgi:hypothetical protein